MKTHIIVLILFLSIILVACSSRNSVVNFVKEGGLETKGLVNLALASNRSTITVSQENPDRPSGNLIDGITSSENWDQGSGWETKYEGFYARGEYTGYGVEDPEVVMDQIRNRNNDNQSTEEDASATDPAWRGLRTQTSYGNIDSAMGWVVIEFPDEKLVNRAVIYTVDSEKYPADRFGVADLSLQYWNDSAKSWALVDRIGKVRGQAGNSVQDNKSGVVTIRFQPVKTPRMRLIVRWTNDSKSVRRGYYQYNIGTIRLAEIEIFGYEKVDTTEIDGQKAIASTQDANINAEIQAIIDNYIDGYNKKNLGMAMSSISSEYSKDNDNYEELKKKLESIFAENQNLKIEIRNPKISVNGDQATAVYSYSAQQKSGSSSGNLTFKLYKKAGYWKITRLDQK
jgi:regulator of replication initiation timing